MLTSPVDLGNEVEAHGVRSDVDLVPGDLVVVDVLQDVRERLLVGESVVSALFELSAENTGITLATVDLVSVTHSLLDVRGNRHAGRVEVDDLVIVLLVIVLLTTVLVRAGLVLVLTRLLVGDRLVLAEVLIQSILLCPFSLRFCLWLYFTTINQSLSSIVE